MNLSKTKYCNAIQCNKMLWLHKNKPEELKETDNNYILDNGTEVGKIARQLLGKHVHIEHDTNLNNMSRRFYFIYFITISIYFK